MADLGDLRQRIDAIDAALVSLLADRMNVCREVAEIKETTGAAVIQPQRVRDVLSSRRQWAIDAGVDADFAEQLFRTLLSETHRIEGAESREELAPIKLAGDTQRSELDTVACRIDHVVVAVADISAARKFFDGMGFTTSVTDDASVVTAEAGGVTVLLVGSWVAEIIEPYLSTLSRHFLTGLLEAGVQLWAFSHGKPTHVCFVKLPGT